MRDSIPLWLTVLLNFVAPAVIASLATQGFLWLRESKSNTTKAKLSAIRAIFIIEGFANTCTSTIEAAVAYLDTKKAYGYPCSDIPTFPDYPTDIDWAVLGPDTTYEALNLKIGVDEMRSIFWQEDLEESKKQEVQLELTADIGLEALDIADRLRKKFNLPEVDRSGELSSRSILKNARTRFN